MKKLILLLLFIPLVSFGQNSNSSIKSFSVDSFVEYYNNNEIDDIEGLYSYGVFNTTNKYTIAIIKEQNRYVGYIVESNTSEEIGRIKMVLTKTQSPYKFNMDYYKKKGRKKKTTAVYKNGLQLEFSYFFGDIELMTKMIGNGSDESIRNWLDKNATDPIEGIWIFSDSNLVNYAKFAILKINGEFVVIIIECYGDAERNCRRQGGKGTKIAKVKKMAAEGVYTFTVDDVSASAVMSGTTTMEVFFPENSGGKELGIKEYPNETVLSKKKLKTGEWAGNGSGVIISKSGYIITNHHVIEDADEIEVEFILNDEVQKFNAEIVQIDKTNDLAILKIFDMNFDGVEELPYNFKTRSSDVGTKVYAFGYPMALSIMGKEMKVTDGMISSKTGFDGNITTYQITAPIQGGNSGGPLFDEKGNLIGINSSGIRKDIADNVAYSIKTSYVLNLIDILPKSIELPSNTKLESLPLTEQIKEISKYVVLIKVK